MCKSEEDKNWCVQIANTIYQQLFWSIDKAVFMSWGVSRKVASYYKSMPSLLLKVSGAIHKGFVIISLDEGTDTYIITLLDEKNQFVSSHDDIYCDSVGRIIDELIEKPSDMSDEEYKSVAIADSMSKLGE